jgi:hypothetical protein
MLGENKINLEIRKRDTYGKLTDSRYERHGGIYTYEFRTPSAEWLTTEKIALSTLAYLGTVYNEIINHPRKMSAYSDIFYSNEKQAEALQNLALANYRSLNEIIVRNIKKYIKNFEFYETYKEEIDYILNIKKVTQDKEKAQFEIKKGWELKNSTTKISKKSILSDRATQNNLKKNKIESTEGLSGIYYNKDINVDEFQRTLGEKIYAFSWKLKNNYFLFGIKEGIEEIIVFDTEKNIYKGDKIITTEEDYASMAELFDKMIEKYKTTRSGKEKNINDLIKILGSSMQKDGTKDILIGIPYSMRIAHNTKPFISLVYDLENKKQKTTKFSEINRKEFPKKGGEISKILSKQNETEVVFDTRSRSFEMSQSIIADLVVENERDIREIQEENMELAYTPEERIRHIQDEGEEFVCMIADEGNSYENRSRNIDEIYQYFIDGSLIISRTPNETLRVLQRYMLNINDTTNFNCLTGLIGPMQIEPQSTTSQKNPNQCAE